MENVVIKKAIINTLKASGGNVKNDSASGAYPGAIIICDDNSADPILNLLPPIRKGTVVSCTKIASAAEVVQIAFIGRLAETIVASTRYKVVIGQLSRTYEGQTEDLDQYAYTSPAVLSGTAATDRANVYTVLAAKINAYASNNVVAYVVYSVAFTGGTTALPQVGELVTQETSAVTARIAAVDVTGGTITGTNAVGTIYLYNFSAVASWSAAAKTLTGGTSGFVCTTNAALTAGAGLVVVDDAGYYGPRPNSKRGPSYVAVTEGFDTATVEVGTATLAVGTTGMVIGRFPTLSQGIGTRMLQDVPSFSPDKTALVSGEAGFILNEAPVSGKTYTTYIIQVDEKPSDTNIDNRTQGLAYWFYLYADESNGTNLGNLNSGLQTALGVTIT